MKNPQSSTFRIAINTAQLAHIVEALQNHQHTELEFNENDVFYVSPEDTLDMLKEILDAAEPDVRDQTLHGLCL